MSSDFSFRVRPMRSADIEGVVGLQRSCFPPPFPEVLLWKPEHLEHHLAAFPEGQFVADSRTGEILGSASNLLLDEETWQRHADWEETVGGLSFRNHRSDGTTLFGADISVHPAARGQGIGRALYRARFEFVRRHRLVRFGTACRMPDFQQWASASGGSPAGYARLVADGELQDRTLTPLLRCGLSFVGVVENHMDDPESGDAAAILEWRSE